MIRWARHVLQAEQGYATLSLAIIGLMFTSMLVIPFLVYVQTALVATRKAGEGLDGLSCGSAGVEHALWRLQYDEDFVDSLTPENPSASYEIICDNQPVPIDITLQPPPPTIPDYLAEYVYADIVLVMDVSASINSNEMEAFKEAAHAIVDGFNLAENEERYRIGLSRFSGNSEPMVSMTDVDNALTDPPEDHFDGVPLHEGVDDVSENRERTWDWDCFCLIDPPVGIGTNIVAGLNGGAEQYDTGLGDRPEIPNLMVFLTDGEDTAGNDIFDIEDASENSGARIFAVGIDAVYQNTLDAIASEPDDEHVFYADNFQELLDLIDDIVEAVTQAGTAGNLYDIEVTAPDGSTIHVQALRTLQGDSIIISLQ